MLEENRLLGEGKTIERRVSLSRIVSAEGFTPAGLGTCATRTVDAIRSELRCRASRRVSTRHAESVRHRIKGRGFANRPRPLFRRIRSYPDVVAGSLLGSKERLFHHNSIVKTSKAMVTSQDIRSM